MEDILSHTAKDTTLSPPFNAHTNVNTSFQIENLYN